MVTDRPVTRNGTSLAGRSLRQLVVFSLKGFIQNLLGPRLK